MNAKKLYPLNVIRTTTDYEKALKSMEVVFDEETGPLADYAETLTILITHYEEENFPVKKGQSVGVLNAPHGTKQSQAKRLSRGPWWKIYCFRGTQWETALESSTHQGSGRQIPC